MDRETRVFEVRALEEPGQFSGYASVFGVVDAHGTVFDQGSFKKTIKDHKGAVPIVWMHDVSTPIGLAAVREDDTGLWFDGQLDLDVEKGRDVYSGMKKGYITQMSHSFASVKETSVKEDGKSIPHYKEVRLFEISPTTTNFASNEAAAIVSVRSDEGQEEDVEDNGADELRAIIERINALLEPSEDTRTEPHGQPGDHWAAFNKELQRVQTLLGG